MYRPSLSRRTRALVASGALVLAGLVPLAGPSPAAAAPEPGKDVTANLWQWNWPSLARECTNVLGPKGYGGVQVAPPQNSLKRTELGNGSDTVLHPWWEVYQPVSYDLTSRMGDEQQFRTMVTTCRKAGVKVYVDAVINHMTGQGNRSYGGQTYSKYDYEGLYDPSDFHSSPKDCPVAPPADDPASINGVIADFNNYRQVTNCELVELADLATGKEEVRTKIAGYLNKLLSYGVSGFRVDAAKHVGQPDLKGIQAKLNKTVDGTDPYFALEVYPGGPGRLAPQAFAYRGDLVGFDAAYQLQAAFKSYGSGPDFTGNITSLRAFGEGSGLLPGDQSQTIVGNHDTERGTSTLSWRDGDTYLLANQFLLAYGYGTPQVFASFTYGADTNQSPPSDAEGYITDTDCASGAWYCTDRVRGVANMVGFHNYTEGEKVQNWYDDSVNLIAFSRGSRAWITINNATTPATRTFRTGLAAGRYCNVVAGNANPGGCSGPTVTVRADGTATVTVAAKSSVALTTAAVAG